MRLYSTDERRPWDEYDGQKRRRDQLRKTIHAINELYKKYNSISLDILIAEGYDGHERAMILSVDSGATFLEFW